VPIERHPILGRLAAVAFALGLLVGCASSDGDDDDRGGTPTSDTIAGCVETVRGCIDPDSIEPGECVPSGPTTDDCVNYRPGPDETGGDD